jgi:hypothetical protein
MAPKNGWHRLACLVFASGLSLMLGGPAAAEITHIVVTSSSDIGPFRGKGYREVQATMEGAPPAAPTVSPSSSCFPKLSRTATGSR